MNGKHDLYFNINYQCNLDCLFCASDMTRRGGEQSIALRDYEAILRRFPAGPETLVAISGGEPTVHKEIAEIVQFTKERGHPLNLFTNGRRFASRSFARRVLSNLRGTLLIPLYTFDRQLHDILTGGPGSFDDTIEGIDTIEALRKHLECVRLQIKLLFFKPNEGRNSEILSSVLDRFPNVDIVSLHTFIQSNKALRSDFASTVEDVRREARDVLETISVRNLDPDRFDLSDMPPCALSSEEKDRFKTRRLRREDGYTHLYFDPLCLEGESVTYADDATCSVCSSCGERAGCSELAELRRGGAGLN